MSTLTHRNWKCLKCGKQNEALHQYCQRCHSSYLGEEFGADGIIKCSKCGKKWVQSVNYCPSCMVPLYNTRDESRIYPKLEEPRAVLCHVLQATETAVLASPTINAERLYIAGIGDVFPIVPFTQDFTYDGSNVFNRVVLPGGQLGYILKSSGFQAEFGLGKVEHPLGYIRSFQWMKGPISAGEPPVVEVPQPTGEAIVVYKFETDDRLPVVEEAEHSYKVQLPSGMRGWVHKARVLRTRLADSLPVEQKDDLIGTILGAIVLFGLGAAMESYEVSKMSRAVSKGIREA